MSPNMSQYLTKDLAKELLKILGQQGRKLAVAESCTGGLLAAAITDIPGSSAIFERGFVTYSNQAKIDSLGVRPETITAFGAVSTETAAEMARGVQTVAQTELALAITGIAGPSVSENKIVGLVYIAFADSLSCTVTENYFTGDRSSIRYASVCKALEIMLDYCHKYHK